MFEFSRSRAPRTTELYEYVWKDWESFCRQIDAQPLPATAETVLEFLRAREPTHSNSALSARKSAIVAAHKDARARLPQKQREPYMLDKDDMFELGWREITRRKGNRHTPRKALTEAQLREIITHAIEPHTSKGIMDRAFMLVSWNILMRRSEVAALNVDDIELRDDMMFVHIRRSKTDKAANGVTLAAAATGDEMCPVVAMREWLEKSGATDGPLFCHPRYKTRQRIDDTYGYLITKHYVAMIGLDPAPYGHHSFRRGGITHMAELGIGHKEGMAQSRHVSPNIYMAYIADKEAAKNPAVHALASRLPA